MPFASSGCVSSQSPSPGSRFVHVLFLLPLAQCTLPPNQPSLSLVSDVTFSLNDLWATRTRETKLSPVCLCGRNPECACHLMLIMRSPLQATQGTPAPSCLQSLLVMAQILDWPQPFLSSPHLSRSPNSHRVRPPSSLDPRGRVGHWPPAAPSCRAHMGLAASFHMLLSGCVISHRTVHLSTDTTSTHYIQDAMLLSAGSQS